MGDSRSGRKSGGTRGNSLGLHHDSYEIDGDGPRRSHAGLATFGPSVFSGRTQPDLQAGTQTGRRGVRGGDARPRRRTLVRARCNVTAPSAGSTLFSSLSAGESGSPPAPVQYFRTLSDTKVDRRRSKGSAASRERRRDRLRPGRRARCGGVHPQPRRPRSRRSGSAPTARPPDATRSRRPVRFVPLRAGRRRTPRNSWEDRRRPLSRRRWSRVARQDPAREPLLRPER